MSKLCRVDIRKVSISQEWPIHSLTKLFKKILYDYGDHFLKLVLQTGNQNMWMGTIQETHEYIIISEVQKI